MVMIYLADISTFKSKLIDIPFAFRGFFYKFVAVFIILNIIFNVINMILCDESERKAYINKIVQLILWIFGIVFLLEITRAIIYWFNGINFKW